MRTRLGASHEWVVMERDVLFLYNITIVNVLNRSDVTIDVLPLNDSPLKVTEYWYCTIF